MNTRRYFLKLAAAGSAWGAVRAAGAPAVSIPPAASGTGREYWWRTLERVGAPVLTALSRQELRATMPVEALKPDDRRPYSHLEAIGRILAGMAPWLELSATAGAEAEARAHWAALARAGIDHATDPRSPDYMNFAIGRQPLVDAAFLAQAMLRAPRELWEKLEPRVRGNVIAALKSSRVIEPGENNWTLFAAIIEAFLVRVGDTPDPPRLAAGPRKFEKWYVGDGWYGDGADFHTDYYNSFVIQPMLVDILDVIGDQADEWQAFRKQVSARLTRYAAVQERLIAPDGAYPAVGRSIAYRCGAFQGLALAALRHQLPAAIRPGQARSALTAVIRRTLEAAGTFDAHGWLTVGLAGHQPHLGEEYISTGSLYLCSVAFLPLGLPADDPFWREPSSPTTWEKTWSGVDLPADHALQ